jgi:hypothetical protein
MRPVFGFVLAFLCANAVLRLLNMSATEAHPVGRLASYAGFMTVLATGVGAYGFGCHGLRDRLAQLATFFAAVGAAAAAMRDMPAGRFASLGIAAAATALLFRSRSGRACLIALLVVLLVVLAGSFVLAFPYSAAKNYYRASAWMCAILGIGYISAVILLIGFANVLGQRVIRRSESAGRSC